VISNHNADVLSELYRIQSEQGHARLFEKAIDCCIAGQISLKEALIFRESSFIKEHRNKAITPA